jgi:hypothetical protein
MPRKLPDVMRGGGAAATKGYWPEEVDTKWAFFWANFIEKNIYLT